MQEVLRILEFVRRALFLFCYSKVILGEYVVYLIKFIFVFLEGNRFYHVE